MSKQTTLFSSWGAQTKNTQPSPQDNSSSAPNPFDCDDEIFGLTEQELEELCKVEDKETPAQTPSTNGSFHVGPSRAFLNSSIIEEGIPGFDNEAGQLWIYPTNYPLRDYQYNIVHKALFTNTLVCLPTGLGKTFIAAVVMYNFYRWYPNGKIVFLAPTKPLVAQQIEACHSVMGVPQEHTSEMTGHLSPKTRVSLWQQKRVFFLTPQVMQNDLVKGTCPALDICCVVFDEAHKALGNHAYCQVVKELSKTKVRFRVLALSATPGNDLKAVQQVVTNLQIGHIELRSEDSVDTQRYVNERKVEKIVVPLEGEIIGVKKSFATILSGVLSRLVRYGVFYQASPDRLAKFQLLQAREQFRGIGPPAGVLPGAVEGDFALAISLFHAYELLLQHGMRSFYQFLATTFTAGGVQSRAKGEIVRSSQFRAVMNSLSERVAASMAPVSVTNGPSFPRRDGSGKVEGTAEKEFFYSHPKLRRLEDVVLEHFRQHQTDSSVHTRVMIFSQYRDSVQEIADMLERHAPLVRVMTFVGHSTGKSSSRGLSQREQTEIVRKFREGGYNTLVATCVGEEGLDIGDVDLIVCFDAPKSPIRLVQRMGRTGRKRKGRIVMILAEGKEDQGYNKSQSNKKSIHRAICNSCKSLTFYQYCHRMVPKHIRPQVHKMHMSVGEFISLKEAKKHIKEVKSRNTVLNYGLAQSRSMGKKVKRGTYLSEQELNCWSDGLSLSDREFTAIKKSVHNCFTPSPLLCLSVDKSPAHSVNTSLNTSRTTASFALSLDRWVSHQVVRMPSRIIQPSRTSENLVSTLELVDLLRASEGMGQSYDLEMQTYLNRDDVKAFDQTETNRDTIAERPASSRGESSTPVKRKVVRKKTFIEESDDEDFVNDAKNGSTSHHLEPTDWLSPSVRCESNEENNASKEAVSDKSGCDPPPVKYSSVNPHISLTQSGHVVPRAPSEDNLDWLDNLEPSQVSNSGFSLSKTPSILTSNDMNFCDSDFNFKTPSLPPFSASKNKLRPSKCSTPAPPAGGHSSEILVDKTKEVCDIFDSVPAHVIFDDFSTSCLSDHDTSDKATSDGSKLPIVRQGTDCAVQMHVPSETDLKISDAIVLSDCDDAGHEGVHIIEESDLEDESIEMMSDVRLPETPLHTDRREGMNSNRVSTPLSEERANSNEDSFLDVVRKCRKRPLKHRNAFLRTPGSTTVSPGSKENDPAISSDTTPKISRCRKRLKVTFDRDSSGDEFDVRPKKPKRRVNADAHIDTAATRSTASHHSTEARRVSELIEEEAEVSDDAQYETDSEQLFDEYDCDDSFINDNSMLTQFSPSQRTVRASKKISKSKANSNNLYLRSLMSPEDHLFAGRRRGGGGRYRMVFSQRHELLNHYINKAGFRVDQNGGKRDKGSRRGREDDGAESSGSEAEEVNELEDECEGHGSADCLNESSSEVDSLPARRRRTAFLSDSEPSFAEEHEDLPSAEKAELEQPSPVAVHYDEVVISPSLLASIKVGPTPVCFSLGMDNWIDWSDFSDSN